VAVVRGWNANPATPQTQLITKLNAIQKPGDYYYFDNTLTATNAKIYNRVEDFLADLESVTFETPSTTQQTPNQIIDKQRVYRSIFGGYDFFVKTEKNAQNKYELIDVTSSEFGLTLGWSWTQTSYATTLLNPKKPNEITVDIWGTENYNIIVENFGTVWKSVQHYQITFDNTTGKIIASKLIK
jgi:hypothetical protein